MGKTSAEELMLFKWRHYFKQIMDGMNAKKIKTESLLNFAIVNPSAALLCNTMEEGFVMANKAIESIKNGQDIFLKYDSKQDAIIKLSIDEAMAIMDRQDKEGRRIHR